ncbi:hypothetical protein C8J57DRAFT_1239055 [Mycena rebaudengoi]|nr:hypothetical protein C8J57DRAFT_1239055 [Mycena rebaudengoi]
MSTVSYSTTSLVSNTTTSSRVPLTGSPQTQPKDFQFAFVTLQSTYGFSGQTPSVVAKPKKSEQSASESSISCLLSKLKLKPRSSPSSEKKKGRSSYSPSTSVPKLKAHRVPPPTPHSKFL